MMRKKKRNSRDNVFPLWAGLLIVGSLAPLLAGAGERTDQMSVQIDGGLVSVTANDVPMQEVLDEIATLSGLRIVQHVALDRTITLNLDRQPLPDVLDELLKNDSYQLYQGVFGDDEAETDNPIPGTLWIFSEGSSLDPAATVFFEAVILHGSFQEKKEAIRELRRLGTPDAANTLTLALSDEDPRVRDAAFEALSKFDGEEALAAIASASADTDPWVRSEAANALSSSDTESAVQYLNLAFNDPDPRVRMTVIEAFTDIPSEQAVAALSLALRDEDPGVRMHAVDALELIGGEIAFQALMQAQSDEDPDVADAVDESLLFLGQQK
jgi:hypothetical protein